MTVEEKATRHDIGDVYLWTALDQKTKLVPNYIVGKRSADMARRLMVDLAARVKIDRPHEVDIWGYNPKLQISTDGYAAYPEAVDLAFGPHVKFGTIQKEFRNATIIYTPSEMVGTKRTAKRGMREGEERVLRTSHVERHNLTIRTFLRRFTRLSLGFSKKLANLEAAVHLFMAYYNFCWRPGKMRVTPAMSAGVVKTLWGFDDLLTGIAA